MSIELATATEHLSTDRIIENGLKFEEILCEAMGAVKTIAIELGIPFRSSSTEISVSDVAETLRATKDPLLSKDLEKMVLLEKEGIDLIPTDSNKHPAIANNIATLG